jgi:hypothetical protein
VPTVNSQLTAAYLASQLAESRPDLPPDHWPGELPPWEHQRAAYAKLKQRRPLPHVFCLAMEQRTGKSRVALRYAQGLRAAGLIESVVVVAMPAGAPRNWLEEFELYWDPRLPYRGLRWQAREAALVRGRRAQDELLAFNGLRVLTVNGEAVLQANTRTFLKRLLDLGPALVIVDEFSLVMKTPGATRTRLLQNLGKHRHARYKLILDGTPSGDTPFDLYSPYRFLDWRIIGQRTFTSYKARYAAWEERTVTNKRTGELIEFKSVARDERTGARRFLHLDELQRLIAPYTYRVTRREAFPNAPQPTFRASYYQLPAAHRRHYDELRDQYQTELAGLGVVTAQHVLTRYVRLQQVLSNFWPPERVLEFCPECEGGGCHACDDLGARVTATPLTRINPSNARLDLLEHELRRAGGDPVLVWCKFHQEFDDVLNLGQSLGLAPVEYTGRITEDEKALAKTKFQTGKSSLCVANERSAGRAVSFSAARLVAYYSNGFSWVARAQSQDRSELGTKAHATDFVDLVAEDTVDERIMRALREKRALADVVLGERSGAWL